MKRFVISDIHGSYKGLLQCFEKSGFDYDKDRLIVLGDVCDGYPDVKQCIDELLKVKNLVFILGNHDQWASAWMHTDYVDSVWYPQGGRWTINSYGYGNQVPESHKNLLRNAQKYYIEDDYLFVHAGINPNIPLEQNTDDDFLWDRYFFRSAKANKYKRVFVGHTPVYAIPGNRDGKIPITVANITGIDTGAGHYGRLTIMDVDTDEFWQSDESGNLYPGHEPRG